MIANAPLPLRAFVPTSLSFGLATFGVVGVATGAGAVEPKRFLDVMI